MAFHFTRLRRPELLPSAVVPVLLKIGSNPKVEFIVLFGSRALGDATETSDVDITVSAPTLLDAEWLEFRSLVEEAPTLLWITLIRFEESPRELQDRNLRDGVVIYESAKAQR